MSFLSPYRAVLRVPHARVAFVSSLAGRLSYGIVSLSLVLTLTASGHAYGFTGLVMALFGLTVVLLSPFRARLIDHHGPRRSLPPMAAGFAVFLVAIAAVPPQSGRYDVAVTVLAGVAGAFAPPLGPVMRTLWSTLVEEREVLQAAYSLDGVAEELLYVTGPLIVGVITIAAAPAVGLLVTAGLVVSGTALFLRSPALVRWPSAADETTGGDTANRETARSPRCAPAPAAAGAAKAGAARAVLSLSLVTGALGLCLGGLGIVLVAFSRAHHTPVAVAWIEAAMSVGSALGGLGYGAVTWRASARRRLALLTAGLAVALSLSTLSPDLPVLALLIALAGMLMAPVMATAYVVADGVASATSRTRTGNWVNSGYNAGSAAGSALSGQLVGRLPLAACLPVLAAPALLAVIPLLRLRHGSTSRE